MQNNLLHRVAKKATLLPPQNIIFRVAIMIIATLITLNMSLANLQPLPKQDKVYLKIGLSYKKGIGSIMYTNSMVGRNQGYSISLLGAINYSLSDNIALGVGSGLQGFHEPTYNTLPLFIDLDYQLINRFKSLTGNIRLGESLKPGESFKNGFFLNIGLYYKLIQLSNSDLSLGICFTKQQIKNQSILLISNGTVSRVDATFSMNNLGITLQWRLE